MANDDNKIVQLHEQPKLTDGMEPTKEPLQIFINASKDGGVIVDFNFSVNRLAFSQIEAASFIGAVANTLAAAIANKQG